jgi:hypothetical protein
MPEGKDVITQEIQDFVNALAAKVRRDDQDRQTWKDKQVVAHNARLGLRRRTNRPYPGAAEVPIPITDKFIKKLKALYVSVATQNKKQISVRIEEGYPITAETRESANKIERALNNLVKKRDFQWTKKITLFVDYFLENGHAVFKVIEKFFARSVNRTINLDAYEEEEVAQLKKLKAEELRTIFANREELDPDDKDDAKTLDSILKQIKGGKREIKFTKKVAYSEPTVIPERGLRIIVPSSGTDLQKLPRITHDMWLGYQELRDMADKKVWNKEVVDSLDPDGGTRDDSLNNISWAASEGVNNEDSNAGLFNVRESETWFKNKKWVFTWVEQSGTKTNQTSKDTGENVKVLKASELGYEHGLWTYVKHDFELKNPRWYASRGIPEQIRGLHQTIEKMYNARLIRDEYNNAPMWRVSKQLGMAGDEIRLRPGQVIEAEAGEVEQINKGVTVDVSSERLEQQAKAYAEEYLSIADFTNRSAVNAGGVRTATEIQAVQQNTGRQLGIDVALFLETLSEVANHMYLILKQSIDVPKVVGGVELRPEDFLVKVSVSWVGSLESTDQELQMQKALQRIGILQQVGMPSGVVTPTNIHFALRDWLSKDSDVENPDMFVTSPEDVLMGEIEEQQSELVRMMNGFDVQVHPDDNDGVHLQVIEEYIASPAGAQRMAQDPAFAQRVEMHANIHIQSEAMKNGTPAAKAQKGSDSRGKIARKTASSAAA